MRVLLVDDHAFMHQGLQQYLSIAESTGEFGRIQVVGSVFTGTEALAQFQKDEPDVVLLDLSLPDMSGLEVARQIRLLSNRVKIMFITMYEDGESVRQAFEVGANGYLVKRSNTGEFIRALRALCAGLVYIADGILGVFQLLPSSAAYTLTDRQRDVLKAVAERLTIEQTAIRLGISRKTVEYHRGNIKRLCGLTSMVEVYCFAVAYYSSLAAALPSRRDPGSTV
mgnify:CR=1 FL=1|jgi:two-component system response regulator NreC